MQSARGRVIEFKRMRVCIRVCLRFWVSRQDRFGDAVRRYVSHCVYFLVCVLRLECGALCLSSLIGLFFLIALLSFKTTRKLWVSSEPFCSLRDTHIDFKLYLSCSTLDI